MPYQPDSELLGGPGSVSVMRDSIAAANSYFFDNTISCETLFAMMLYTVEFESSACDVGMVS